MSDIPVVGIDFGTSGTKVAMLDESGKPISVLNERGETSTPTVVHRSKKGQILHGTDAIEQGVLEPEGLMRNFKLGLGEPDSLLEGVEFTAGDAAEVILRAAVADAERATGSEVEYVVITSPANMRDDAKKALLDRAEQLRLKVLLLMAEPTAAGFAYALHAGFDQTTFAVYDFGGGTFDVSIIRVEGGAYTVLATEGIPKLGGNDLTMAVFDRVLDEVENVCGRRPTQESDALFMHELWNRSESCKVSLARQAKVPIVVQLDGTQVVVTMTQDEFHGLIDPLIGQTLDALDRAIAQPGLGFGEIDRLLVVGGTSRSPRVQELLADHTGLVPKADIDPVMAIAFGASLACGTELARAGLEPTVRGQVIPVPEVLVRDVTGHCIGCCVLKKNGQKRRLVNAAIIEKNTPVPCSRTQRFRLEDDLQDIAIMEILQGEADAERDDCLLIGELRLEDLPREQKRSLRISVEYTIDRNRMVTATATDAVSGKSHTVSIDYQSGVTSNGGTN